MMNRTLLAALPALLLAACQTAPTPAQVATDAAALAKGVNQIAGELANLHDLSPQLAATIEEASADAAAAASALAQAEAQGAEQTLALRIAGDVNAVVGALAALPNLPQPVGEVLNAAQVLLPVFEAEAGIAPAPTPTPAASAAAPLAAPMSADEARRILEGGHG
jgi:hypothetical protein